MAKHRLIDTEARGPAQRHERVESGRVQAAFVESDGPFAEMARELSRELDGEVRFGAGDRALYATDASNYRQVPTGVVVPRTIEDVRRTVSKCAENRVPITSRGGGTSLVGQSTNTGLVIDFSKYLNHILALDPDTKTAVVEPGCVLDELRDAAEAHGLTFGPDPATHDHNTLGGMIGNNSCGVHSVAYGRTADNVLGLRVLTYRGLEMEVGPTSDEAFRAIVAEGGEKAEIYRKLDEFRQRYGNLIRTRFPDLPRRVSGFADLDKLLPENGFDVAKALVGTEGTCVTVLEAKLQLSPSPSEQVLVILGFKGIDKAADAVPKILEFGPRAIEGIDCMLIEGMERKELHTDKLDVLPEGHDWLVVEFGGDTEEEAEAKAAKLQEHFEANPHVQAKRVTDPETQEKVWLVREAGLPASAYVPDRPEAWEGWEDTAVPREKLGDYVRDLRALYKKYGYESPIYGHFGDGLVHCRVSFDLKSEPGIAKWRRFLDEAADLVIGYGGSLSGEHGDGQGRAELLEKMYGPELVQAFREFKAIWDPHGRMNPGKVVDAFPITSNLRLGPSYTPPELETHFHFGEGGFAAEAERCVGVGKCRRNDPGTQVMCPSYLVTGEEKHSTRGRARLLFEMLHGGVLEKGWKSDEVEDALDLCLACKGCKSDCPVNVDMATYKAEFRSHYYEGRLRPRAAYAMGRIYWWSRIASKVPWFANAVMGTPGVSRLAKWVGDIAPQRQIPRYADQSFTSWFQENRGEGGAGPRVVLWPDTFNNYFRPDTAIAAVKTLEALGFSVTIPSRPLCCGRPIYDWGLLDTASKLWQQTFTALRQEIDDGIPVIGLEPACTSAFKDELLGLFPGNEQAKKLSEQTHYFSDFVAEHLKEHEPVAEGGRAVVHFHCNHHAVLGKGGERQLIEALGVEPHVLPSGCCGMAGSFGFEADKYELSQELGERVLLPSVRAASEDDYIVSSGFSCREQIEQSTGRRTLHAAELAARRLGLN
ncbi:FAD-binding and (Fe-S)-binding domain-containing protein [Devosia sp. RR2S18]|uniref:FAD-binding and (Fe-S)-binding domain-containing protein n=1 Tax=Devosia rhizosphaerae TaxID=3049774 RepID=UPI002540969F|nr:FAD-binding and (Fe-S)-binding domain-containing protein [Devosia sp. RR2S18]WIJ26916.1 FAD-binding and (Fe-S)-binding domain-containing protein [Devosia sp. RR2S18]